MCLCYFSQDFSVPQERITSHNGPFYCKEIQYCHIFVAPELNGNARMLQPRPCDRGKKPALIVKDARVFHTRSQPLSSLLQNNEIKGKKMNKAA